MEESLEEQDVDAIMQVDPVKAKEKPKLKRTSSKIIKSSKEKIEKVGIQETKLKTKSSLTMSSQSQLSNDDNCITSQANTKHKKSKIIYVSSKKEDK